MIAPRSEKRSASRMGEEMGSEGNWGQSFLQKPISCLKRAHGGSRVAEIDGWRRRRGRMGEERRERRRGEKLRESEGRLS